MTHVAWNNGFAHLKLGRNPVLHDARTLQLADYIEATLPPPPAHVDYSVGISEWPMYGNDRKGDCTCAAAGHMVEVWTHAAGKLIVPADADVERFYIPVTGSVDNGRNEISVLNKWHSVGFGGDKIDSYAQVKITEAAIKQGTYLAGGLYTGVALPLTAQTQHVWDVVPNAGEAGEPGSWGGHAVPFVAYDTHGVTLVTWGGLLKATWAFVEMYFEEAYAVLSKDWLNAKGVDIHGLNLSQLHADLAQIH